MTAGKFHGRPLGPCGCPAWAQAEKKHGAVPPAAMMQHNTGGRIEPVPVHEEPIELYKLLKLGGLVRSGGEAKHVIAEGLVRLNGMTETRRRKKVMAGDTVEFAGKIIRVIPG